MTRVKKTRNAGMACPHCGEKMTVRTSNQVTLTVREMECQCGECGFRAIAQFSLTRVLRQPDVANAEVPHLPFTNRALQWDRRKAANDDAPIPANEDGIDTPAAAALRLHPG